MTARTARTARTAVVTGAASGIGRELAVQLGRDGWHVVVADLDGDGAAEVAAALPDGEAARLDVTDADAVHRLVHKVHDRHGLGLMVNNAGISPVAPSDVPDLDLDDWERVLRVNLLGVVHGVAAAYPLLVRQGTGAILSTASLAGLVPGPGLGVYAAAKHAVVGYTLSLRAQAARYGVRVVTLCPGWVDTPLLDVPLPDSTGTATTAREQLAAFGVGRPVPASEVAAAALDGVRRNRALVVVPRDARWTWRMHRYAPALSERVARRIALRQPPYRLAGGPTTSWTPARPSTPPVPSGPSTPLQPRVPGA